MVDIAQLVSASDCGSEGRGVESHYPPHKKYRGFCLGIFYVDNGIRKPGTGKAGAKNSPGDCFLGRGRIPVLSDASGTDVGESAAMVSTAKCP